MPAETVVRPGSAAFEFGIRTCSLRMMVQLGREGGLTQAPFEDSSDEKGARRVRSERLCELAM